jgi:RNA polymerase sigma-70 factor (ECF subfamily)
LTTLAEESESYLIQLAQKGNRNAFGELVRRYYPSLTQVVFRFCGDPELAQDAVQEAFLRAWIKLATFQGGSPIRYWLFRIAINAARDVLRRKPTGRFDEEQPTSMPDQTRGPEAVLIDKERSALIQKALRDLPDQARTVLVLREFGELSYREISAVLDIPVGTVMSRLHDARIRLRGTLQRNRFETESNHG